jgi:predicted nuclease of predicted toxin-antitoxin system
MLRADGHDVVHIAETARGAKDTTILALAHSESRLVLTEDKDFGDLAVSRAIQVPGIVLLRVQPDILSLKMVAATSCGG